MAVLAHEWLCILIGYFPRTLSFCCEHREQGSHSTWYRSLHCKYLLWVKDYGVSLDTNELIFSPKSPSRISLPKMVCKSTDLEPLICSGLSSVVLAHLLWEVDSHEWISFSSTLKGQGTMLRSLQLMSETLCKSQNVRKPLWRQWLRWGPCLWQLMPAIAPSSSMRVVSVFLREIHAKKLYSHHDKSISWFLS